MSTPQIAMAGSAFGGFTSGLSNGMKLSDQQQARQDAQQVRQAKAAAGKALMGYADQGAGLAAISGQPQPMMPGQASTPDQPPMQQPTAGPTLTQAQPVVPYANAFAQASKETGIPVGLLERQAKVESGLNPAATNPETGAMGIGQILPSTAKDPGYGLSPLSPEDARDPAKNIMFQAKYLKARGDQLGVTDWNDPNQASKALNAYSGGGGEGYASKVLGGPPAAGSGAVAGGGDLDLKTAVSLIKKSNPDMDPRQVFETLEQLRPMMNMESAAAYKKLQEQLAVQRVAQGEQKVSQGQEKIEQGQEKITQSANNVASLIKRRAAATTEGEKREIDRQIDLELKTSRQETQRTQGQEKIDLARQGIEARIDKNKADVQAKKDALALAVQKEQRATTQGEKTQATRDRIAAQADVRLAEKQVDDAAREIASLYSAGTPAPVRQPLVDAAIRRAGVAGATPPATPAPTTQPKQPAPAAAPPPEYVSKVKAALARGIDREALKKAVKADGYDPADFGL